MVTEPSSGTMAHRFVREVARAPLDPASNLFELRQTPGTLGRQPGGEALQLLGLGSGLVELGCQLVELGERCSDLLVGALELPQARERLFGH